MHIFTTKYKMIPSKSVHLKHHTRFLLPLIIALGVTGCAIKQDTNNRRYISLDYAAVLGTEHTRFRLQDSSEGSLRSMGGNYSIKLEKFFKVIPLGMAQQMQLQQAFQINGQTVLVINIQDTNGCVKTAVLSIEGSQVLHWVITPSDCKSVPTLTANAQQLQLSYSGSRYLYENNRLVEEKPVELALPQPSSKPTSNTPPAQTPKRAAGNTARVPMAQPAKTKAPTPSAPATRQTNRANTQNVAIPTAPPELRFNPSTEEQKPVIINLE